MGPLLVRRMVSYVGSVEGVFREKRHTLQKIPGIGIIKSSRFDRDKALRTAEKELEYIRKHEITVLFYLDEEYPNRLRECEDGPLVIFFKGEVNFNAAKVLSFVGTRKASVRGRQVTEEMIAYLGENYPDILIISGLAYGIDICAHKKALDCKLRTIAALGHGFEYMYPAAHRRQAAQIARQGALVTEFLSCRKPDPGNFVSRNRIIAGLADATIIIESAVKGGALITADLANSYNRDVFAVPGRVTDTFSKGCNQLIRLNKAALAESGKDIEAAMGWIKRKKNTQRTISFDLNPEEKSVLTYLDEKGPAAIDLISLGLNIPVPALSALLLNMEFRGLVKSLPGKYYQRI